mmetsp:Transcript_7304/g.13859  ORF Transcript_7304/g.13859 Transcript_7304/m.13859 type:complete len:136 (+) Transcript_7304:854-1261(+)
MTSMPGILRCINSFHLKIAAYGIDDGETIESIARAFIEADPLCVRIANKRGWSPLHTLCSNFLHAGHLMKPDFLKVLIEPYRESMIVENKGGVTPWEMLLSNFVYNVNEYIWMWRRCSCVSFGCGHDPTGLALHS